MEIWWYLISCEKNSSTLQPCCHLVHLWVASVHLEKQRSAPNIPWWNSPLPYWTTSSVRQSQAHKLLIAFFITSPGNWILTCVVECRAVEHPNMSLGGTWKSKSSFFSQQFWGQNEGLICSDKCTKNIIADIFILWWLKLWLPQVIYLQISNNLACRFNLI